MDCHDRTLAALDSLARVEGTLAAALAELQALPRTSELHRALPRLEAVQEHLTAAAAERPGLGDLLQRDASLGPFVRAHSALGRLADELGCPLAQLFALEEVPLDDWGALARAAAATFRERTSEPTPEQLERLFELVLGCLERVAPGRLAMNGGAP